MFRNMPFLLLAIIALVSLFGGLVPPYYQSIIYGLSLSIKSIIVFVLPFVVFSLLFRTTVTLAGNASKIILLIFIAVCCSNFISTMISYNVGSVIYDFDLSIHLPHEDDALMPIGDFSLPKWIANDQAMLSALILGWVMARFRPALANAIASKLEKITHIILKGILFVIPLFITGFVMKMNYDQVIPYIASNYSLIFVITASAVYSYIAFLYWAFSGFKISKALTSIRNILPAAIAGFGSMSSAAAMPLTILGAEKNAKDPEIASAVIPATVNIHLIGDCFAIPIFAFAVLKSFGIEEPSLINYVIFAAYFVLAKFSVAAIPGGGILVMIPILETYLGFTPEMLSLITALYILFDPVITGANVLGNGGFAIGVEKLSQLFLSKPPLKEQV